MNRLKTLLEELSLETGPLKRALFVETTPSTNELALQWGKSEVPAPALIVAAGQSAGRGRRGRNWESSPGKGLYFSLLLRPPLSPVQATHLNLMAGLALQRALQSQGIGEIVVQWPNDVMVQGKKVAGILSEMHALGSQTQFVVMGMGINFSQSPEDFSEAIREKATSLKQVGWKDEDQSTLLRELISQILRGTKSIESEGTEALRRRWEKDSNMLGCKVAAQGPDKLLEGTVLGLNKFGHLRILLPNQSELALMAEEVRIL